MTISNMSKEEIAIGENDLSRQFQLKRQYYRPKQGNYCTGALFHIHNG
jgi:hypothetical protein